MNRSVVGIKAASDFYSLGFRRRLDHFGDCSKGPFAICISENIIWWMNFHYWGTCSIFILRRRSSPLSHHLLLIKEFFRASDKTFSVLIISDLCCMQDLQRPRGECLCLSSLRQPLLFCSIAVISEFSPNPRDKLLKIVKIFLIKEKFQFKLLFLFSFKD